MGNFIVKSTKLNAVEQQNVLRVRYGQHRQNVQKLVKHYIYRAWLCTRWLVADAQITQYGIHKRTNVFYQPSALAITMEGHTKLGNLIHGIVITGMLHK